MKITTYKHNNLFVVIWIACISIILPTVQAQSERPMSMADAIALVKKQNWDLQKMEQHVGISFADKHAANTMFLPTVFVTETLVTTNDPMQTLGMKLGQSTIASEDFNPESLNRPARTTNFSTRINVEQPLINLDGWHGLQAARMQHESTLLEQAWLEKMMVIKTKDLYYQLVLAIRTQLVIENVKTAADSNLKVATDLYEQELTTQADLMGAQLQVMQVQSQWLEAKHHTAQLNAMLLQHFGEKTSYLIVPTDSLPVSHLDRETMTWQISEEREDLKALELKTAASGMNYQAYKGKFIPRINAFGSYGFNDTQLLGTQASNYLVGVQLRWDIFRGGAQWNAAQKARFENQYLHTVYNEKRTREERELLQLRNDLEMAESLMTLAQMSATQAKAVLQIRQDRYAEGLEKTSDLLTDEANFLTRQLEWLRSQYQYLQLLLRLEAAIS